MASSLIRLRRTLRALSGVTHSISAAHASSFSAPIRCAVPWSSHSPKGVVQSRSFRSSSASFLSVRSSQSNIPDEIGPDTILFEGCDYNHWLFVMDFPRDNKPSPEDMVRAYEETCAKGLNIRFLTSSLVQLFLSQCFDYNSFAYTKNKLDYEKNIDECEQHTLLSITTKSCVEVVD